MYPEHGEDIFSEEFEDLETFSSSEDIDAFDSLLALRRVYQAIELERQSGNIKNALDCELQLTPTKKTFLMLKSMSSELSKFL